MNEFIRNLQKEILKEVDNIEKSDRQPIAKAKEACHVLGRGFAQMKEFIIHYHFRDEAEEIDFFKHLKPQISSLLIYYQRIINIELNRPVGSIDMQKEYFFDQLSAINTYRNKRLNFYRYYMSGHTHLDSYYFLRRKNDDEEQEQDQYQEAFFYELDSEFSTSFDLKIARIQADEKLTIYLMKEIDNLELERNKLLTGNAAPRVKLTWQGSKTDLIENIYAWDTQGYFGDVPLVQVVNYMEEAFNIDQGNTSRSFNEMRDRNDPVAGLNKMIKGLLNRMQQFRGKDKKNNANNNRSMPMK